LQTRRLRLLMEGGHVGISGGRGPDQQEDRGRARRNVSGKGPPVPHHGSGVWLHQAHLVRAVPGGDRARAVETLLPDRANEAALAAERLVDRLDGDVRRGGYGGGRRCRGSTRKKQRFGGPHHRPPPCPLPPPPPPP